MILNSRLQGNSNSCVEMIYMLWCALRLGGTTCIIVDVREMRKRSRKKEKGAIMSEREYTGLNGEEKRGARSPC